MRQSLWLPQPSLSAMRNLKTNVVSTRPSTDRAEIPQVRNTSTEITKSVTSAYPTVWKKAFALGQNVRFTRTPEVELLRKRVESDPGFAEKLKAFEAEQKRRRENASRNSSEIIEQQQVKQNVIDPLQSDEDAFAPNGSNRSTLANDKKSLNSLSENCQSMERVFADSTTVESGIVKPIYLSDSAFFECAAFTFGDFQFNSVGPNDKANVSGDRNASNAQAHSTNHSSITDLYRVLECRFSPQKKSPSIDGNLGDDAQAVKNINRNVQNDAEFVTTIQPTQKQGTVSGFGANTSDGDAKPKEDAIENKTMNSEHDVPYIERDGGAETVSVVEDNEPEAIVPVKPYALGWNIRESETPQRNSLIHEENRRTAPTIATISAPFRTLNPAFIPSPKAEHDGSYTFPSIDLLQHPVYMDGAVISQETLERSAGLLESVLEDFGIKGEIIHVRPGPVVTMYEFEPAAGVKSSRVISLSDDIARSMSAVSARVAVIPGRNVIGIELPNKVRETVYLRELIQSKSFQDSNYKLPLALGKNIGGEAVIAELAKMPHLLVAGTTGSGKSVAINAMILSLLYRLKPEQCRLIMVDPKMLELSIYDGIPHLLTPVVTDPKKAVTALKWAVREMEDRYRKMAKLGVRNIDGFNARVTSAAEKGETITCTVQSGFDKETGEMLYHEEAMDLSKLPYIVVIVDEMADLMMVAGKEIEGAIQRLAQMARAAGIHLIMATQRPSVDVITGTIKANFPTRISFQVTSKIDSRTILGEQGAETLLGQGDMLHMVGGGRIVRVHGPFVSDEEVEHVVAHLKTQGTPDYLATVTDGDDEEETIEDADSIADIVAAGNAGENVEELYLQAVKVVMRDKKCSTSYIQRRLAIGYNKAASLVERMEEEGIVGPANHVGKREILLNQGRDGF